MKQLRLWDKPPTYSGHESNRSVLKGFVEMLKGIAATCSDEVIFKTLKRLETKIEYYAKEKSNASIGSLVNSVFLDLIEVREALEKGGKGGDELNERIYSLECNLQQMIELIRADAASPWEGKANRRTDRRIAKLSINIAKIRLILRQTTISLQRERRKLANVLAELRAEQNEVEREGLIRQQNRVRLFINLYEETISALRTILDELSEIESLARNGMPALATKANRRIRVKRLADFAHPNKARAERANLSAELLFLIHSIDSVYQQNNDLNDFLYGRNEELLPKETPCPAKETRGESNSRRETTAQSDLNNQAREQ